MWWLRILAFAALALAVFGAISNASQKPYEETALPEK